MTFRSDVERRLAYVIPLNFTKTVELDTSALDTLTQDERRRIAQLLERRLNEIFNRTVARLMGEPHPCRCAQCVPLGGVRLNVPA